MGDVLLCEAVKLGGKLGARDVQCTQFGRPNIQD